MLLYAGIGGSPDFVDAYKWFTVGWTRADNPELYATSRDALAKKMTPVQIAKAEDLARQWLEAFERKRGAPIGPPPLPPPAQPVRVGGDIAAPERLKHVEPVYPPIAVSARVQGVVIVEATIGVTGKVEDARVVRSIPLLDAAALDAVKQWEYAPTLLKDVAVPVIMTVTVSFSLR